MLVRRPNSALRWGPLLAIFVLGCAPSAGGMTTDEDQGPGADARAPTSPSDAGAGGDAQDADTDLYPPTVGGEICDNGLDDDGDGEVDEGCRCAEGEEQPCFAGPAALAGVGACTWGMQTCDRILSEGEFPVHGWGACQGSGLPSEEICDALDNDCDGTVDPECDCLTGDTRPCASVCGAGAETCQAGFWGACDAPGPGTGPATVSRSPWEMHRGAGPLSFGFCTAQHGDIQEYNFASIPAMSDPGWGPAPNPNTVGYSQPSTLCGQIDCRCGGDFTYFRTLVTVQAGATLGTFTIHLTGMDDGTRCTIYNSANPGGLTVAGAYVFLGGSATANLAPYILAGETNTILLTHVDDCCSESNLNVAEIVIDGQTVSECP